MASRMVGQYVVDDGSTARRPGVLVFHEGPGLTEHTKKIAARLAGLGYAAFAMDYHGEGKPLANLAEVRPRMAAWIANPTGIMARATAALEVLKAQKEVDTDRGWRPSATASAAPPRSSSGAAAATSRRSSASIPASPPSDRRTPRTSRARCWSASARRIPIIPPEQRAAFESEMKAAGIDWRLQLYGGAGHSFTNPAADCAACRASSITRRRIGVRGTP